MESAPATIPATTHPALTAAFGEATFDRSWSGCCSPARRVTGTRPAERTRLGSSKTASIL